MLPLLRALSGSLRPAAAADARRQRQSGRINCPRPYLRAVLNRRTGGFFLGVRAKSSGGRSNRSPRPGNAGNL